LEFLIRISSRNVINNAFFLSLILSIIVNVYFIGSDSDQPKRKRRKNTGKREKSRRGAVETLKGKMVKSKETISTSESDSDADGLKIASG